MSHVKKIIQAIKIKMMLNRLSKAKENAMREFLGLPPRTSWFEDCSTSVMTCVKDKCCQIFFPCCLYDRNRRWKRLSCWDSPVFKDFIGFLGGVLLSLLLFFILVYQMDAPPVVAFITCAVASLVLTGVMAFSDTVRCVVLLMLPQFFSGKGRMLLLMYALFLAINHPLMNMSRNITVMSQSTTCGQEMALNGTKELVKAAKAPIQSVMDSVEEVIQKLQDFSNGLRDMYVALENSVGKIAGTIKEALEWVMNMVKKCNDKMGAPYQKCMHMFHTAKESCRDALFWPLKYLCDAVDLVDGLCKIVKIGELLCKVVAAVQKLLRSSFDLPAIRAMEDAREMFYFKATISYKFNYTFVQSKSYGDIRRDITREIQGRLDSFIGFISITKNIMTFAILLVLGKALIYRYKWLTDDRYDNIYITFTVRDLDERRKEKNRLGIMPLTFDEECRYVSSVSATMIPKERKQLAIGLVIFILSFFNAGFYMFCDFGLYTVLRIVEKHFSVESKVPIPPHTKLHVAGQGPMADMYRSIVAMFDPLSSNNAKVDIMPCVPHPHEPDWNTYKIIGSIYFVCLILTITEAYGLRLRHIIMACYFPRRERKRAIWLYNHILKTRGPILDAAKSSMKKRHAGELDAEHISLKGRLAASYPIFEKIFKWFGWEVKSCLYCGREGKPDDYFNFVHCAYYDCDAVYCLECFADLDNVCPVCMKSVEVQGAGASEEVDSSLDERGKMMSEAQKRSKEARIKTMKAARRPSKRMADIRAEMGVQFGAHEVDTEDGTSTSTDSSPDSDSSTTSDDSDAGDESDAGDQSDNSRDDSRDEQSGRGINNSYRMIHFSPETGRGGSHRSYTGRGSINHDQIRRGTNNSSSRLWKHRSNYNNHNNDGYWYGRNLSNNANSANKTMNVADSDSSDSESSEISDCSSVHTEDLDFSYQEVKSLDIDEVSDDAAYVLHKQKKGLDLVSDDAFDSLESDGDESDSVIFSEPRNQLVFRI